MDHKLNQQEIRDIQSGRAYLIDVRSDQEVQEQTIKLALHWDVQQMVEGRFPDIAKQQPVFVFCRSGSRSATAQRLMSAQGFSDVHDIGGLESIPSDLT